jgi:hypothetical protein
MLITCPSCGGGFEIAADVLGVKATVPCPLCRRVVVVRDAHVVPPGKKEGTVPFDPGTEAAVEPLRPSEEKTDVSVEAPLALPRGLRVSVAILSGPRKGQAVTLEKPRFVLGRSGGDADLELPDPQASRAHAALECRGARVTLRDLGSRNGTFCGDDRIQAREIESGAEFRVGDTRLMLVIAPRGK